MKIAVKDLRPNPFRHIERYPINREKVAALKASIKQTTFWDNLLARKSPDNSGKFELAYGHHRNIALKEMGIDEIDIPVRNLDDDAMAKIMVQENMEEWGTSALVQQESIRAIVEGFAAGRLHLPPAPNKDHGSLRCAPSFVGGGKSSSGHPELLYSAATLTKFLGNGWPESKVEAILAALAAVEKGLLDSEDFQNLSTHQAEMAARQVNRVVKETGGKVALAKTIGKRLAAGMRSASGKKPGVGGRKASEKQSVTYHGAKHATDQMMGKHRIVPKKKTIPDIDNYAGRFAQEMAQLPTDAQKKKIESLIKYREHMRSPSRTMLARYARALAKKWDDFADKVES